ncbi:MAG TPA: sigma-70 family RNA polymerase sigma factor [Thermoanaerobaculia bacterium]|nr:sigma-70 family RNA polymerase sigma factor [Thermoanaerobaculia bacterium]
MSDLDQRAPVALDDFLHEVEPRLKRLLSSYRIPVPDAEDLVQQALLALIYHWDKIRDPECWLMGTLKRHCLMYWRGRRRRLYRAVDSTILEWLSEPVSAPQERRDLLADLDSLIRRLPPRCRSLLQLRFRLGYEPPEVAARLGYRTSSIGKITNRCLAALNRELLASGLADRAHSLEVLSSHAPGACGGARACCAAASLGGLADGTRSASGSRADRR